MYIDICECKDIYSKVVAINAIIISITGAIHMNVSYKKLFKILIDKDMKRVEFAKAAGIGQNTLAKMGKGQYVSMEILVRICRYLECTFDDIVEILPEDPTSGVKNAY